MPTPLTPDAIMTEVDLRQLAVDRHVEPSKLRSGHSTRYIIPLVLLLGFLSLVGWASRDIVFPPTAVTVVPVYSTTVAVRSAGTPLFKAAGWIEPRPTPVRVAALAPGVVEQLLVVEDQAVKAGQPIAQLIKDDANLAYQRALADQALRQAELDEANAAFAAAKTRFEQPVHLQAALSEAEALLARTNTEVRNLPFEIRRAESEHRAMKRGYEGKASAQGAVAGFKVDMAKSKADSAKALLDELQQRADSLSKEHIALARRRDALQKQLELLTDETQAIGESQAKIKAAEARLQQSRVSVAQAKLQLDRMTIVAPIDGRVFRLVAHPGARVGSGMSQMLDHDGSTIITMYRPKMMQVRVDVRFEDIPKVGLKQPVELNNPALPHAITGDVLFVSSEADIQKNTLQVKVAIHDAQPVFKPEMLVDVTFLSRRESNTTQPAGQQPTRIFVPRELVQNDETGAFVWIADQSRGIARRQAINTVDSGIDGMVEVPRGLNISSRLITSGIDALRHEGRIRVTGEDAAIRMNSFSSGS